MTSTLIGAIASYLLPLVGRFFGIWEKREEHKRNLENDRLDHQREMELADKQAEVAKAQGAARVISADIEAGAAGRSEANKSYRAETKAPMSVWVHNIRGCVRPGVTAYVAWVVGWKELNDQPISPEFAGIAVAVILFWFGGRDILHYGGKAGKAAGIPAAWNWLKGKR